MYCEKTKKIAAAVLAMTMAAGLAVTGCSGKGGSTDTDPAAAEQSKETAGSAGESKDDAAKADDGALHLTFYYPVNVGGSAAQLIEKYVRILMQRTPIFLWSLSIQAIMTIP